MVNIYVLISLCATYKIFKQIYLTFITQNYANPEIFYVKLFGIFSTMEKIWHRHKELNARYIYYLVFRSRVLDPKRPVPD